MRNYNTASFTPEEVAAGFLTDLLNYLTDYNRKNDKRYYDIHITTDGYCSIVEWCEITYDFKYECGKFEFVDGNEEIVHDLQLPDGTYIRVARDQEDIEIEEYEQDHPEWKWDRINLKWKKVE